MRRDLDLIRKMVLAIEDAPSGFAPELRFDGYTEEQVAYHSYLLIDAGYAEGADVTHMGSTGPEARILKLKWAGHEFAAAARDDSRWKKALGLVEDKAGSVTLEVLKQLLAALMKSALGLP
jgi:hypothetical protein